MIESQNTKANIVSSLLWKLMERSATQGIQFVIQIILARLLLPEEFGAIAIVMVFISLANVFIQSGFNTALIQKKDADEVDFSSVLYLSVGVATILYVIIFLCAPLIANFYNQQILIKVLRVLSSTLLIGAFNSIQNAYVAKHMLFKKLFASSLVAAIISGIVGLILAYSGLGIWALVTQHITNQILIAVILWCTVKWRPRLLFSIQRLKLLFSYGSKLLVSSLIDTMYRNLRTILIGKIYTPSMLGYYNRGEQFPQLIVSNINGSIQSVMLPTLSVCQDNRKKVKDIMRRAIVSSSFLIFPMMIGMAAVAEPLIRIVLTDRWLSSVPFLQIACFNFALWPIHTANLQAINAMGRSDIFLKLEIIKKIVGIIILVISLYFGIYAIALGGVISGIISTFINAYPNKELLNYSYREQCLDIMPSFIISFVMGGIVYLFNFLTISVCKILILQIVSGVIIYILLAKMLKIESYTYLVSTMNQLINYRKNIQK